MISGEIGNFANNDYFYKNNENENKIRSFDKSQFDENNLDSEIPITGLRFDFSNEPNFIQE